VIRRGALALGPALLVIAAAALGSMSLFALALGLTALYFGCVGALWLAARRLVVTRAIDRTELQEGAPITLQFTVAGLRGLPVRVEVLGERGAWEDLADGEGRVTYVIDRPGAHVVEPSPLRLRDDLGLFSRRARGGVAESLLVLPAPAPPERLRRGGAEVSGDPEPDGLRPYTPGTPMSRVHWASAARGGDLQERHFTTGRDQLPLVVVDTADADDDALAWVARSAAGLVLAFSRAGGCRVLLPGDRVPTVVADPGAWPAMHRRLAALEPGEPVATAAARGVIRVTAASAPDLDDPPRALPPGVVALSEWTDRHAGRVAA
jgi:uncharacterized protein (DUF58 family)